MERRRSEAGCVGRASMVNVDGEEDIRLWVSTSPAVDVSSCGCLSTSDDAAGKSASG